MPACYRASRPGEESTPGPFPLSGCLSRAGGGGQERRGGGDGTTTLAAKCRLITPIKA